MRSVAQSSTLRAGGGAHDHHTRSAHAVNHPEDDGRRARHRTCASARAATAVRAGALSSHFQSEPPPRFGCSARRVSASLGCSMRLTPAPWPDAARRRRSKSSGGARRRWERAEIARARQRRVSSRQPGVSASRARRRARRGARLSASAAVQPRRAVRRRAALVSRSAAGQTQRAAVHRP